MKETIEEAAERYAEIYRCPATNDNEYCKHDIISAINFGAKWQQERMFEIMNEYTDDVMGGCNLRAKDWFEQFKKK
jgi:hypothetical protein